MRAAIDWKKGLDLFFADTVQVRASRIVMVVVLVLLAAVLAQLTWRLVPGADTQLSAPPLPRSAPAVPAEQRQWNIAQWHLFGVKPEDVSLEVPVESLPETTLNLVLRGVVASSRAGEDSGAIIGAPGGVDSFYPVNARLPGGATLKEVYPDRVVLERAGRLETLRLPKESLDNGSSAAPARTAAARQPAPARSPAQLTESRSLREYRDIALSNPQQLGDVVNISPRSEDGRFLGYEVRPGRDPGLLDRVGLVPGDVVTSINGIALDTPARALSVLRSLQGADQVRIDFQRDGVPQSAMVGIHD
jgi:general secretion pathway protein C